MLKTKDGYAKVIGTSYQGSSDYLLLSNGDSKAISSLSVSYASSAGNADTLDGTHLNGIFTAFGNNAHNITATIGGVTKSFLVNWAADSDKLDGYHASNLLTSVTNTNNGISVTVGGTTKSITNISVNHANSAGSATKVIVNQHTTNDTNYPLVWSNQNNSNNITENQLYKSWSDLYYNPKYKRLTVGGSIYAAHFYESSDKVLKKNIKSILSSTNIPKIREFDWKDTGEHSYGFIAQELEEQGYGCLVSEANGKKTVNYTATLALTVAKLQNLINIQNKKISNLTKELKALKYGRKKNS